MICREAPFPRSDIKQLAGCKKLAQLFLVECQLEPGSLTALSQFENLNELDLSGSSVVDQELNELAVLNRLATLRLIATHVSDAGLLAIEKLPNLRTLYLSRSQVSDAGIAKLKQKLPQPGSDQDKVVQLFASRIKTIARQLSSPTERSK